MPPSAGGHPGMEHGDAQLQQLPPTAENLGKRKHLRHHARPPAAPGHPNLNQDVPTPNNFPQNCQTSQPTTEPPVSWRILSCSWLTRRRAPSICSSTTVAGLRLYAS